MEKISVWQAIVQALEAEEVEFVFGVPGSPINLYDSLYYSSSVKPILVRHEASAAFMAMAYSRLKGRPGICHGTLGPGVTNLFSGILEAYTGCTPIIAVCPTASLTYEGMGLLQEADQISMITPMTKWRARISRPERTMWTLRRAFSLATNGKPCPVFVEMPQDIGQERVKMPSYRPAEYPARA